MSQPSVCLSEMPQGSYYVVNEVVTKRLGHLPIAKGDFHELPPKAQRFIAEKAELLRPRGIYICDGSHHEAEEITHKLIERGSMSPLKKLDNCYIVRTDPRDVARVESKTWIVTPERHQTVTHTPPGVDPEMGHWMAPDQFCKELDSRFPGCMAGRMMYVIPFSMGPIGSPLSKIGIQVTDSNYVVLCMRVMTRVSHHVWDALGEDDFVRCIHSSLGLPPRMAEHMLITGVTHSKGTEHFMAAAFPSACGKTNLAMIKPGLVDFRVRCVGDDIAWMRFDKSGTLRGINPEAGLFGVAPGTNMKTNPNAMATFQRNSIFTNVAETADGMYFWEGLEDEMDNPKVEITTWLNQTGWHVGDPGKAAHPNSRFTTPASQCPIIHPLWEDSDGVPIEAIIFGGRRPKGVPLIYEAFSWAHGVFVGACLKSEATAAAEQTVGQVMHDAFAMRPFMGYNFGNYMQHWLDMNQPGRKMPRIYHVNWFRLDKAGHFLWPGFGENIRVLDWIIRRVEGDESIGVKSPLGILPTKGSLDLTGLGDIKWDELFNLPKDYYMEDMKEQRKWFEAQVGPDMPAPIRAELDAYEQRIKDM